MQDQIEELLRTLEAKIKMAKDLVIRNLDLGYRSLEETGQLPANWEMLKGEAHEAVKDFEQAREQYTNAVARTKQI